MKEITKDEALQLTKEEVGVTTILDAEDEKTESLVILKKTTTGFVLAISCATANVFKYLFSQDFDAINQLGQNYLNTLKEKGNPFLDNGMSKIELQELASQLGKPEGDKGVQIGLMMNETNISMIRDTIKHLSINNKDHLLELGHGNANHLSQIYKIANNLNYAGLDISEVMKQEAEKFCMENELNKQTSFQLYDGTNIPFSDNLFDKIFTVNTIYFWQKPKELIKELQRVLKPNGTLCITFVDEETMNHLTFTDFGFTKYNQKKFMGLIENTNLKVTELKKYSEMLKSKMLGETERKYWVMTLTKNATS